uniref:NADH dehydrogenase subunit 6 n=1 Tax=Ixodes ovatus TaxID=59652 RepID=UPI001FAE84E8|nr:NADH dehydrogenase subunit 6 [Ixodes ovatus]UNO53699.1 NADH dehydrogenase subunit 6 [Ixodes ovatus]
MKLLSLLMMTFFMFNHPMSMLLSIIMSTIIISFLISKYIKMTWVSLILILLVLGGMLILFLYVISLIPNKKMNMNKKLFILFLVFFVPFKTNWFFNISFYPINSIFFLTSMNFMLFMMVYLLISLMIVMKIMKSSNSPLKLNN